MGKTTQEKTKEELRELHEFKKRKAEQQKEWNDQAFKDMIDEVCSVGRRDNDS